jgi:Pentapeptide repeats (8 copies)
MPSRKPPSIPSELQQSKAYQLYQQRKGEDTNSAEDWDEARKYFENHPQEVIVWKLKRLIRRCWQSLQSFLVLCWRIFIFPWWVFWKLPELFAQDDTRSFALDVVKTLITAVGLVATFVAGIGLIINYWSSEKNIQLTQERLITDRFSKAIEQLGSNQETVVLGGIYSLERIAKDSPKDQWTIVEVMTSYIRRKSPISKEKKPLIKGRETKVDIKPVNITVQAALTVIGRRNAKNDNISGDFGRNQTLNFINLSQADLSGAYLSVADLSQADLSGAKT